MTMPDVVGKRLDVAISDVERAGFDDDVEVLGGGTFGILDKSNWTVCSQQPEGGTPIADAPRVTVERTCEGDDAQGPGAGAGDAGESEETSAQEADQLPKYGQPVRFTAPRGCCPGDPVSLEITVSSPTPFTPSDPADATQAENIYFAVTLRNTGDAEFNPNGMGTEAISGLSSEDPELDAVAGGGIDGDPIFDLDQDVTGGAVGLPRIPPGESITFQNGFSVASADDVTYRMRPYGLGGDTLYFTY